MRRDTQFLSAPSVVSRKHGKYIPPNPKIEICTHRPPTVRRDIQFLVSRKHGKYIPPNPKIEI